MGFLIASGCERAEARTLAPSPDDLVLELGGPSPSLRAALLRLATKDEPVRPTPVPPAPVPQGQPAVTPPPPVVVAPPPPEVAKPRVVRLRPGGTLYALAREHLGDGNRWREITELNDWTEDEAARLPANVEVKLPPR